MKIVFFNTSNSKVPLIVEITYLPTYLLMADNVHFDSIISVNMLIYSDIDYYPENIVIDVFEFINKSNEAAVKIAKETREIYNTGKDLKKAKHKDKSDLVKIGHINKIIKNLRTNLKEQFKGGLQSVNFLPIIPFYTNEILTLDAKQLNTSKNIESSVLTEVSNLLINNDATLSLSDDIDDHFSFDTLSFANTEMCSYIKIPLWEFPPILVNSFEYLNYTRNELMPFIQPFKDDLDKLQKDFFSIDFTLGNLPYFKQKISEKILPHVLPFQQAIEESLFIKNIRNGLFNSFSLVFCLGIAPAETIVNYYEHFGIIEPFEANELKNRISRHINLKSTFIFTYFDPKVPTTKSI